MRHVECARDILWQFEWEWYNILPCSQIFGWRVRLATALQKDYLTRRRSLPLHYVVASWLILIDLIEISWLKPEFLLVLKCFRLGALIDTMIPATRNIRLCWFVRLFGFFVANKRCCSLDLQKPTILIIDSLLSHCRTFGSGFISQIGRARWDWIIPLVLMRLFFRQMICAIRVIYLIFRSDLPSWCHLLLLYLLWHEYFLSVLIIDGFGFRRYTNLFFFHSVQWFQFIEWDVWLGEIGKRKVWIIDILNRSATLHTLTQLWSAHVRGRAVDLSKIRITSGHRPL